MKIAVQLYTLRDYFKTPEDAAITLKKIKGIGYNAVQASGIGPIDPQTFKILCDEAGIEICATHVNFMDMLQNLDAVIEKHKIWECKYAGIGSIPVDFRKRGAEGYSEFAKVASEVAGKLKAAGLQFVYHNHEFEFEKFDGKRGMDILFDESDRDSFGFEIDVHWVQAGGASPVDWINKVAGRMQVVHLKDYIIVDGHERRFAEVGEGNMNFASILAACEATGVEWGAVEQDNCYDRDPIESITISYQNLKALGAKF